MSFNRHFNAFFLPAVYRYVSVVSYVLWRNFRYFTVKNEPIRDYWKIFPFSSKKINFLPFSYCTFRLLWYNHRRKNNAIARGECYE